MEALTLQGGLAQPCLALCRGPPILGHVIHCDHSACAGLQVFRIGHLGNSDEIMQASALAGTEMALLSTGLKIKPGSGVGAAIQYWAETSKPIKGREDTLP